MEYYYCNPTGNITILVDEEVPVEKQPEISNYLCKIEPTCEQVGFVYWDNSDADIRLRMAGGEFCGNATMCTAAFFARKNELSLGNKREIKVSSSGAPGILKVLVERLEENYYAGTVEMPKPKDFVYKELFYNGISYMLPIVMFDGMYHAIIEETMDKEDAEKAVVEWCDKMQSSGFGLMFLNEKENTLTPLVYVPALKAFYWEHSCASGTTATGYYLFKKYNQEINVSFKEPGGKLGIHVTSDEKMYLSGHVKFESKDCNS